MTAISNLPAVTLCHWCNLLSRCRYLPDEGWTCKACLETPWGRSEHVEPVLIPLRDRHKSVIAHAQVDAQDAHLAEHRWYRTHIDPEGRGGYAARTVRNLKQVVYLHRVVLDALKGAEVDHINGDRLDCRRGNLRLGTRQENAQNLPSRGGTSRHRGVHWSKSNNRWCVTVPGDGKTKYLGSFTTESEAAETARAWRAEHMPFANENRSLYPLEATMLCGYCGHPRDCTQMPAGWWVCRKCRPAALKAAGQ